MDSATFHEITKKILVDGYRAKALISYPEVRNRSGGGADLYVAGDAWYRFIEISDTHIPNYVLVNAPRHMYRNLPGKRLHALALELEQYIGRGVISDEELVGLIRSIRHADTKVARFLIAQLRLKNLISVAGVHIWRLVNVQREPSGPQRPPTPPEEIIKICPSREPPPAHNNRYFVAQLKSAE